MSGIAVLVVARDMATRQAATDRPPSSAAHADPAAGAGGGRAAPSSPPTATPPGEDGATSRSETGPGDEQPAAPSSGAATKRGLPDLVEARREGTGGARPRARARAAQAAVDDGSVGTVRISSSPWAEVRVVGRSERCAETPCTLSLPSGQHTLTLRNPVAQLVKTVRVDVRTDQTVTVRETLTAPH